MPIQIRRNAGRRDFIPTYSTDELLRGVCHIVLMREPKEDAVKDRIARVMTVLRTAQERGREVRQIRSKEKFEANKEEIYTLLANGRGIKHVSGKFSIGYMTLKKYLNEEEGK
jgi:hypothetical protein